MSAQISQNKKVLEELGQFFEKFGFQVSPSTLYGEEALTALDQRSKEWSVSFTFKVTSDGKKMEIVSFVVNTPLVVATQCGILQLIFDSDDAGVDNSSMTFFNPVPISHDIDSFLLKVLVERPAYFLVYVALASRIEIDMGFVEHIANLLYEYNAELSEEKQNELVVEARKFST
jgi:hypothetical protein